MDTLSDNRFESLKGHFLIAMPGLNDPFFGGSVICICEHTEQGALGLVINHPHSLIKVDQIFEEFDLSCERAKTSELHIGGPVQLEEIFVLHGAPFDWQGTIHFAENMALTNTIDILHGIAENFGPEDFLLTLGCSGWGPGQLESEMLENAWLTTPVDYDVIFNVPPKEKWNAAVRSAGIDPVLLTSTSGHA